MGPKDRKGRFCDVCPRRLSLPPNEPCPLALERINALQLSDEEGKRRRETDNLPGCPWYVTSAEHGHCFWNLMASPDGLVEPFSDKDICDLLMLSQAQVDKAMNSAIAKLRAIKATDEMQELKELIYDRLATQSDDTIYMPGTISEVIDKTPSFSEEEDDETKEYADLVPDKGKMKKKVQLFGLYSQKTLQRIKEEKDADRKARKKGTKE